MPIADRHYYLNLLHLAAAVIITSLFAITIILLCVLLTPHFPSFEVTALTVSSMPINTTVQQKQTVTFNFQGLLENPNALLAVWYKKLHFVLWFNNSSIASLPLEPPRLSNKVQTNIPFQVKFAVVTEKFPSGVLREIAAQRRAHGSVNFGITLRAWIKFKFSGVGLKPRFLSLKCYPLQVAFSPEYSDKNDTGMLVAPSHCFAD
ncbi:hypothetical protein VNO80_14245 [Phaseolus coccineus]|uniref:Late embryogenesis abundant protein LEA-2 subgroup domain-containing protein n=1 Tax=Phaseolus coccineus TaxID=3886 RepID=A0AAN9MHX6_PHACN